MRPRELLGAASVAALLVAGCGSVPERERPASIVLILVDTLRADRMGLYGHSQPTTPRIDALFGDGGTVFESAYAQAPWTLPSVASMFAGRPAEAVVGEDLETLSLPDEETTLAETLEGLGYETAAFIANPSLHAGNGFAQGFGTFFSPDDPRAIATRHAGDLNRRLLAWLETAGSPYFLYVHYVDPHDPYLSPDLENGRSRFFPDYDGPVRGDWVHGLHLGRLALPAPARDLRHLQALYDSEILFVDGAVGELVAAIEARDPRALVLLVSDHGEELLDHGGWKHGRTVYEEQLRVPLLLRWPGEVPAPSRRPDPVRLLDVGPTLVDAAGGAAPDRWVGSSLLPLVSEGAAPGPAPELFAQHLSHGPLRATARADGWKLVLFDRFADFVPTNDQERLLYDQEVARLERLALYHLPSDPEEHHDLSAEHPERMRRLSAVVQRRLGAQVPGLRVLLTGAPPGSSVAGELELDAAPDTTTSLFLAAADELRVEGRRITFELRGESLVKGFALVGSGLGRLVGVGARLGEATLPVRGPDGREVRDGTAIDELVGAGWRAQEGPSLLLWVPESAGMTIERGEVDEETLRRLRALGYVGR